MRKNQAATPEATRLVKALDANYRYRRGEMLRWMLSDALKLTGLSVWESPPDEVRNQLDDAIHIYEEDVARAEPFEDILGCTYMALVSSWGKSALGQYFTPQPVARMMAEMTLGDLSEKPDGLITVCDPAIGSGVMILSFMQSVMQHHGTDALRRFSVTGIDLDPVCIRMFALQMLANCAIHRLEVGEILAYHGNALGDPRKLQQVLHASAPGVPSVPAKHPERLQAIAKATRPGTGQLPLFDLQEAA